MNNAKLKIAYLITERNGQKYWNRIGVGFVNSDGSINVKLNAIPVGGEFQLRDYVAPEDRVPNQERTATKRTITCTHCGWAMNDMGTFSLCPRCDADLVDARKAGRTPDGFINNCALANGDTEANCQMCHGKCPDRARFAGGPEDDIPF